MAETFEKELKPGQSLGSPCLCRVSGLSCTPLARRTVVRGQADIEKSTGNKDMSAADIDPVTEAERATWPDEAIVPLEKPYVDDRGAIQPLVDRMMRSAVMIESKKGALRANHYHKTDWHYCYVMSGCIEYYHRPTGSEEEPEMLLVKGGQMVFTPPMIDHGMKFPEDTVFLTLSRNPRDQATYEADVVRVDMLDDTGSISWRPEDNG